jgi:spoIIIJ-associated protein
LSPCVTRCDSTVRAPRAGHRPDRRAVDLGDLPPATETSGPAGPPTEYGDETVTDTSIPRAEASVHEEADPTVVAVQEVNGDADVEEATEETAAATDNELFRQSEIAADYVEGLLDILDYDGDIDELVSAGRPVVEVVGDRLQSLVGQRGATVEALQELTRLAVFRQTGTPSRLLLDVGGYRASRRKELAALAKNAVEKVKQYGQAVRLEPMSAFERKCVHDVVNALAGVVSESEGVEPHRRIVVRPAD